MKRNTLNKSEDFTFEGRLLQTSSTNCLYKKNSPRIKPIAVALSIVLAGLSFPNQVAALQGDTFTSPWIVEKNTTINLRDNTDNQINVHPTTNNVIAVIYGTINFESGAFIYPNRTGLPFNGYNSITVYGQLLGSGNNNLFGAYNKNHASNLTLQTSNNTVIFKAGSKVDKVHVYGAKIENTAKADDAVYAYANSNTVIIEKGSDYTGNCYVVGGYALSTIHATASDNKIIIGSGTFTSEIIAGWTTTKLSSQKATMSDNEVYLYGDADVSGANIYGAIRTGDADSGTTVMTGNTLIFGYNNSPWAPSNYTVGSVNNFSTIRMDAVTWGKTITINSLSNNSTDSTETKINAENVSFSGAESLSSGDSYEMLNVSNVKTGSSIGLTSESSTFTLGSTLKGTASLKLKENIVTYKLNTTETQEQTHTAAMTSTAAAVALTQGADTASAALSNLANSGVTGVQAFSSVGGGASRVKTGSHVNVQSLNFSVGVGNNIQNDFGQLSVGGAFEAGFGKFKNHFDAGNADPYIKKNGDISYYGIAALSNMSFDNLWHINGALRYGRIKTTQNRALYNFNTNQSYDIDLSSYYIGTELGGGKIIRLNDLDSLDLYGKYFFLHQDGNTFNAGGKYELSSVNSHRLRLAGKYSHSYTPTTALYAGLGAEYEFDGKSKLKVDGIWGKPSKTDGIRGFGELGVTIKPAANKGLIFDLGVKGLLGDKFRGAWANAEIKYLF